MHITPSNSVAARARAVESRGNYQRNDSPADLQRSPLVSIHLSFLSASQHLNPSISARLFIPPSHKAPGLFSSCFVLGFSHDECGSALHLGCFFCFFFTKQQTDGINNGGQRSSVLKRSGHNDSIDSGFLCLSASLYHVRSKGMQRVEY